MSLHGSVFLSRISTTGGMPFSFLFSTLVVTIGFNRTYSVREDVGGISIVVVALTNSLTRDVVVTLSTLDDTARGRFVHCLNCIDSY